MYCIQFAVLTHNKWNYFHQLFNVCPFFSLQFSKFTDRWRYCRNWQGQRSQHWNQRASYWTLAVEYAYAILLYTAQIIIIECAHFPVIERLIKIKEIFTYMILCCHAPELICNWKTLETRCLFAYKWELHARKTYLMTQNTPTDRPTNPPVFIESCWNMSTCRHNGNQSNDWVSDNIL